MRARDVSLLGRRIAVRSWESLDHIGFEVNNLQTFVNSLEAKGIKIEAPIRQVPNTKLKVAFLTDPWGTYIELTEGLTPE